MYGIDDEFMFVLIHYASHLFNKVWQKTFVLCIPRDLYEQGTREAFVVGFPRLQMETVVVIEWSAIIAIYLAEKQVSSSW